MTGFVCYSCESGRTEKLAQAGTTHHEVNKCLCDAQLFLSVVSIVFNNNNRKRIFSIGKTKRETMLIITIKIDKHRFEKCSPMLTD